jgi:hypothetical protein
MEALEFSPRLDVSRTIGRRLLAVTPEECAAGLTANLWLLDAAEAAGQDDDAAVRTCSTRYK